MGETVSKAATARDAAKGASGAAQLALDNKEEGLPGAPHAARGDGGRARAPAAAVAHGVSRAGARHGYGAGAGTRTRPHKGEALVSSRDAAGCALGRGAGPVARGAGEVGGGA
eukprot:9014437-Pyramimonas_sp.AAC.1